VSARREFSRATRRDALRRSGQRCEAVGPLYGHVAGHRCNADLAYGVEFDHVLEATLGGDASLENCAAICVACHRFKSGHRIGEIRKADRARDKHSGAWKRKGPPMPGSRASGWKRTMDGRVIRREGE
jgi:5-methylcytosine-specific restriction endonuclease McrA